MYTFLKTPACFNRRLPHICTSLIDLCLSSRSLIFTESAHALFIKLGFSPHTFLDNRLLALYTDYGSFIAAHAAFVDIKYKNVFSFNIYLKTLLKWGRYADARKLFDEMPVRDAVTWNTIIAGSAEFGCSDDAFGLFMQMKKSGVRYTDFTYSTILSAVHSSLHVRQVHGCVLRIGFGISQVVTGNSFIDAYGKFGLSCYAVRVFELMDDLDVISWNSLIWACYKSGDQGAALNFFLLMKASGFSPDEFTMSTTFSICCDLGDTVKGKQDAIWLFNEAGRWDSALCNCMISSYVEHDFGIEALSLFVLTMKENIRPTDFTMSIILNCIASFFPLEQVGQFHTMVCKLGFMSDLIVASSLVDTYLKFGSVELAIELFTNIRNRDLISWNTMILGLARNGRVTKTLHTFKELLENGLVPDRITLAGILLVCNYGGLVDDGMKIFFSMGEKFGVLPEVTHYASIIDLLSRAGKHENVVDVIKSMPHESTASIWGSVLWGCSVFGDLKLIEMVAEKVFELEPKSTLPYLVLAQAYESRAKWESLVRLRRDTYGRLPGHVVDCSSIGLRNLAFAFRGNQIGIHGGDLTYCMLTLLTWDVEEGYLVEAQKENISESYLCDYM